MGEAGDVRVRVVGVAESKVPLEARKKKVLSADAYFVVWVEVENTSAANHTYRRWQPVTTGECTVRYAAGNALAFAYYPPDASREWFTEFTQPLPAGGPPLLESLVFSRPDPATDGPLTLTLDATRAGGTGRVTITIPHAVWAATPVVVSRREAASGNVTTWVAARLRATPRTRSPETRMA